MIRVVSALPLGVGLLVMMLELYDASLDIVDHEGELVHEVLVVGVYRERRA